MEAPASAVVESVHVSSIGASRDLFTVKIDESVINTLVLCGVSSLQEWLERTSMMTEEKRRVFGLTLKTIPLFDEDNEPDEVDEGVTRVPAVFSLCYGNECMIYQLHPDPTGRRGTLIPWEFLDIFSPTREHIFVGSGIRDAVKKLRNYVHFYDITTMNLVDIVDCNRHPALNTGMALPTLRSMGRKILGKDIVIYKTPFSKRPWDSIRLSKKQIESLAVSSFLSAIIYVSN